MDRIRKLDTSDVDIMDDPALRTTAANFPFQHVPIEQLERIIKTVQRDRFKQKRNTVWTELSRQAKPSKPVMFEKSYSSSADKKPNKKSMKKKVIKTSRSTVKILTQQMVEEDIFEDETPRSHSYSDYIVPRVRIMTDDEIQRVVENAVKEVLNQHDESQMMATSSINPNRNTRRYDDDYNTLEQTPRNIEYRSNDGDSSDMECVASIRKIVITSAKSKPQDENKIETTREGEYFMPPELLQDESLEQEINNFNDIPEKPEEETVNETESFKNSPTSLLDILLHDDDDDNEEENTPKWVKVDGTGDAKTEICLSPKSKNEQSAEIVPCRKNNEDALIETLTPTNSVNELPTDRLIPLLSPGTSTLKSISEENNEVFEKQEEESIFAANKIQEIKNPTLSRIEREELRKLLGIKEMIDNSEIDLDRFDESEKDRTEESEEGDGEPEELNQKNIFPVIHIRQPIPMEWVMESSDAEAENNVHNQSNVEKQSPAEKEKREEPSKANISTANSKTSLNISLQNPIKAPNRRKKPLKQMENGSLPNSARALKNRCLQNSARAYTNYSKNSARQKLPTPVGSPKKRVQPPVREPSSALVRCNSPPKHSTQTCLKSSRNPKELPQEEISSARLNELNEEKMLIYSKITSYQEKIIVFLDQLKISLLNLTTPDGQPERKRREKHVIEFSARFGRNYLYQLDRLIVEIRSIPRDLYLNKHTNDYRTKVCAIYGILYQAVQSYLKQIKYFLLDQSPRKLDVLIGFIIQATKISIHKKIFSKRDELISSLLERCNDLLEFLENLHEQRNNTIKAMLASGCKKVKNVMVQKETSNWSLAMPKKLSMYESSTVSLKRKPSCQQGVKSQKKRAQRNKSEKKNANQNLSEVKISSTANEKVRYVDKIEKPKETLSNKSSKSSNLVDPDIEINTQVETMAKDSKTLLSPASPIPNISNQDDLNILCDVSTCTYMEENLQKPGEENVDIDMKRKVFETLQSITQKQVHQILGPLVSNLGFVLNENTSALDFGTLFSGLNSVTTQMVNVPASGSDTFNQKDGVHNICGDGERLDQHAVSNEQQLDLSQSKHRSQALWNRQINPRPGVEYDVVHNTSPHAQMVELPVTNRLELSTIEEERSGSITTEKERSAIPSEDEGGANLASSAQGLKGTKVQQLRYDRNIQFTFVSSENDATAADSEQDRQPINLELNLPLDDSSDGEQEDYYYDVENAMPEKLEEPPNTGSRHLQNILQDRLNFIQQIAESPLYVNTFFSQPWKIVTRLTEKIVDELTNSVENYLSFGEEGYIQDFLRLELGP